MHYDNSHRKCYLPEIQHIEKLKFLGANSIQLKLQFEFVPRDTEKSEFLDLLDFGGVAISVETITVDGCYLVNMAKEKNNSCKSAL